jgi:hypothetical protein
MASIGGEAGGRHSAGNLSDPACIVGNHGGIGVGSYGVETMFMASDNPKAREIAH